MLPIHEYFGQANVLGFPDTGGQIVCILDQVYCSKNEMLLKLKHQGLNIKSKILIVTPLIPYAKGIDVFDMKFNVISLGADMAVYLSLICRLMELSYPIQSSCYSSGIFLLSEQNF